MAKYAAPLTKDMIKAGRKMSKRYFGFKLPKSAIVAIWSAMHKLQPSADSSTG